MKTQSFYLVLLLLLLPACAVNSHTDPVTVSEVNSCKSPRTQMLPWGYYYLEIARDGSWVHVSPNRSANVAWGYHINAVKLLEVSPCTDCLSTSNVHVLANGDVSVDITLIHPWPHDNLFCTGFDVRGIIMFPASRELPDQEMRAEAGLWPTTHVIHKLADSTMGDAELMNPDGWITIWAPDADNYMEFYLEEGLPIFECYPGKWATGEDHGTLNAYKHYWTNEDRHMFEVGKEATGTYVIRPPEQGNIKAAYAVYAHWAPPVNTPVTDPASDFPPEANSPLPYEFSVTQDSVIDPDAPIGEKGSHIHWHVKCWDIGYEYWHSRIFDYLFYVVSDGIGLFPHISGIPDDYATSDDGYGYFETYGYELLPGALPGKCPYIFKIYIDDPDGEPFTPNLATEYCIADIEISEPDGEW